METSFGKLMREKLLGLGIASAKHVAGCTPNEIEAIKSGQHVEFLPKIYLEFLSELGHGAGGLFQGSDYTCTSLATLKDDLSRDLEFFERDFQIPQDAFVFMSHQGYVFWYFHTIDKQDDPVVYRFHETEGKPIKASEHLSDFFEESMKELAPIKYAAYKKPS